MGVSIEIWRACIGSFQGRHNSSNSSPRSFTSSHHFLPKYNGIAVKTLLLISTLLMIGCIEVNPGPSELKCTFCPLSFKYPASYGNHQEIHAADKKFSFPCCKCDDTFTSVPNFQTHYTRFHHCSNRVTTQAAALDNFSDVLQNVSFLCSVPSCQENCRTMRQLRLHLADHINKGYVVLCPFQQCSNTFTKVTTFRTHLSQYHKSVENGDIPGPDYEDYAGNNISDRYLDAANDEEMDEYDIDVNEEIGEDVEADEDEDEDILDWIQPDEQLPDYNENLYPENLVRDHIVKFYLMLEGELVLPKTKVQRISKELATLFRISHYLIKKSLTNGLNKVGMESEHSKKLIDSALKRDIVHASHHKNMDLLNMTTDHMRQKFYRQKSALLMYEEKFLGRDENNKKKFTHYIKIEDTLQVMFNDKSIQKQIDASFQRKSPEGVFSDFMDGSTFTDHPICGIMDSLQLIIFQDAFEFFPLGPAAGAYKCNGFYFALGNIHPNSRSQVDAIQLIQLVIDKDLKTFTPEECLKDLIKELTHLTENGILYKGRSLPVILMHLCGDNLGQNYIGKYIECFTYDYYCRFCEITRKHIQDDPTATLPLRTPEAYDQAASQIDQENAEGHCHGVKGTSVFNSIPGFHVCNPAQPPCIGHDILEGTAKSDLALYLQYFINEKAWITFKDLNRRISNFKAKGRDAADKMVTLKNLTKIRGHASEIWQLIRMLPFLIGDKIKESEDEVWKLCLLLKKICEYTFAPSISEAQAVKLQQLNKLYVETRAKIFNKTLLPKHHFMLHHAILIWFFGPLIRLWTLRFESRHVFFKKAAKAANNYINITKTLVDKYTLNFAYKFTSNLFSTAVQFKSKDTAPVDEEELVAPVVNLIREEPSFDRVLKTARVSGIDYAPGLWVIVGSKSSTLVVGEILLVLYDGKNLKLILKQHDAVDTFQGYYKIAEEESKFVSRKLEELPDYYPLASYEFQGQQCLTLKHSNPLMDTE